MVKMQEPNASQKRWLKSSYMNPKEYLVRQPEPDVLIARHKITLNETWLCKPLKAGKNV
jgi:hypothetical protein